jgi:hypothetical protein
LRARLSDADFLCTVQARRPTAERSIRQGRRSAASDRHYRKQPSITIQLRHSRDRPFKSASSLIFAVGRRGPLKRPIPRKIRLPFPETYVSRSDINPPRTSMSLFYVTGNLQI